MLSIATKTWLIGIGIGCEMLLAMWAGATVADGVQTVIHAKAAICNSWTPAP